ncbi:MAG: hypothetical protein RLZZ428_1156 [Pseudomonadota bacterium]
MDSLKIQYAIALALGPIFGIVFGWFIPTREIDFMWFMDEPTTFFMVIVFYPVVEELAFRGVIQEFFTQKTNVTSKIPFVSFANLMTSLLFVVFHLFHHPLIWALSVFFPSLLFGYFKEKFGHILPSIVLHIVYNLTYFLMIGK